MMPEKIILQSAGSLSVALLALLIIILQTLLFFKKAQFTWYAWSAAISFSTFLYSVGIFIEYNTIPGSLNRFSGLLEYTAIICLVHCMYGFTFSYLGIESRQYHPLAGIFHGIVLILLWSTDYIVAESYATWDFIGLETPYTEPALGSLGPAFVLYAALAAVYAMIIWIKYKETDVKYRIMFLVGMGFWILLGIHDGLASLGVRTFQYIMEYGFLGFALLILWVVISRHLELETEEKYRVITELANDCIMMVQDGKIVFGNPACYDLMGRSLSSSEARCFFEIIDPEDRETCRKLFNSNFVGGSTRKSHTVRIKGSDGEQRFVEMVISLIRYRNKPAVLAIMRDITERKRKEEALRESEEKLARAKKMESLGLLAGGVAHDLNNVLSGIINYPELILMDLPEESKLKKHIKTIQEAGYRAVAIVQDLLTVARGVAITKEPLNLNNIVSEYLISPEFIKLRQFHPTVTIETNLDADLFNVRGSSIHLKKALMNLVSNASEAIEGSGRVTINTMNRYVDRPLRGYDDINIGEYAVLSVSDTGPGVQSDALERIFEPFYTKKILGRSGTGLGLAVVWNVVQDHKGYIDVISETTSTTFTLYFPITRDEIEGKGLSASIKDYKGSGESILVVDDVASQRELSCEILSKLGYAPKAVPSGEAAVEYLKENAVDLMLLDMIMDPGINGRQTFERAIKIRPNLKAIIVSGFAETEEVAAVQRLGAGRYIKKPFTFEKVGLAIKEELEREKSRPER